MVLGLLYSLSITPTPQPVPSDNDVNMVASGLYCPVCYGVTLDICTDQVCSDMRALIRSLLQQGYTEKDIQEYFANLYGPSVLVDPSSTSWGWALYSIPLLGLCVGLIVWYTSMKSKRTTNLLEASNVEHIEAGKREVEMVENNEGNHDD
jgi:cytochrome c-type biogenesis protein CcmH/NrfF